MVNVVLDVGVDVKAPEGTYGIALLEGIRSHKKTSTGSAGCRSQL